MGVRCRPAESCRQECGEGERVRGLGRWLEGAVGGEAGYKRLARRKA
jgi:hypothetical protein